MNVLGRIIEGKRAEVAARRRDEPEISLRARAEAAGPVRDFEGALRKPAPAESGLRVIAELKRASPSRGPIRPGADAAEIARSYSEEGAAAMSVLTDGPSFGGNLDDLVRARASMPVPVLRKDFVIDPYQVWEARAAGADAVLLIAAALDDGALDDLGALARELGMAALVEVHDREELERAGRMGSRIVGVNNRDLRTLRVSTEVTRALLPLRPPGAVLVGESGFSRREEMEELAALGVDAFLIGESLMRAPDPGAALREITGGRRREWEGGGEGGRRCG